MRARRDGDVAARQGRAEISDGGAAALAVADRVLQAPEAFLLGGVVVVVGDGAELGRGRHERVVDIVLGRAPARLQRPVRAAIKAAAAGEALGALEIGQHVGIGPAAQPRRLRQAVVIEPMAAHVSHDVDRGRAAQHLAARVIDAALIDMRLRLAGIVPVPARIVPHLADAQGNVDEPVIVGGSRFEHENAPRGVLAEPRREHAPGRARADDDGVVARHARHISEQGGAAQRIVFAAPRP